MTSIQERQTTAGYSPDRLTRWYRTDSSKAKAVVVHGLNFNPEKMDQLIEALHVTSIDSLRVTLPGHGNSMEEFKKVTAQEWVQEFRDVFCIARREAMTENQPLYFIGYSMGAATGLAAARRFQEVRPDKAVLMAPALRLTRLARVVRWLFWWNSLVLPSRNHDEFVAHRGTPIPAYEALFEIVQELESVTPNSSAWKFPALVIVDPKDELVDVSGLRHRIKELKLTHWSWREFEIPSHRKSGAPHHAIIHPFFTGKTAWETLTKSMQEFLVQKN